MEEGRRVERLLHWAARWLAAITIVASPWMFGSVEPWTFFIVTLPLTLGGLLWLLSVACCPGTSLRAPWLTLCLILLLAFAFGQSRLIPQSWVRILNPLSVQAVEQRDRVLSATAPKLIPPRLTEQNSSAAASLSPSATRRSLFLLTSYVMAFLVLANGIRKWHHLQSIATVVVAAGFLLAVTAIVHKLSGSRALLWYYEPRYGGTFFGTFTNRNHFAFYAVCLFGLTFGLLLSSARFHGLGEPGDWREKLAWVSTKEASRLALLAFALAMIGGAICMSLSRGAVVSLLLAVGVVTAMLNRRAGAVARNAALIPAVLLVAAVFVWLGWEPVLERLGSLRLVLADPIRNTRTLATIDTLRIARACPLLGSGYGTFQYAFPMFARPELLALGTWLHAHNDWAQMLAEGGLIGAFLVVAALAFFVREIKQIVEQPFHRASRFVFGASAAVVAAMAHSAADYSLHKPANALLLAAVAGMIVAGSALSRDTSLTSSRLDRTRYLAVRSLSLVAIVCATLLMTYQFRSIRGSVALARFEQADRLARILAKPADIEKIVQTAVSEMHCAMSGSGWTADDLRHSASSFFRWTLDERLTPETRMAAADSAAALSALAAYHAPTDYLSWLWLARNKAVVGEWDAADDLLAFAGKLRPGGEKLVLFPD